jgi:hypothetical protein
VEHGTAPLTEVYDDLRGRAANHGVTDPRWLIARESGAERTGRAPGNFDLHRIGDAVASRDIYSSIHEAYRLCSKL